MNTALVFESVRRRWIAYMVGIVSKTLLLLVLNDGEIVHEGLANALEAVSPA